MRVEFHAGADDEGRRLESVLRRLLPHQSLGSLQKALRRGDIRLNGSKASADARVTQGDTLAVWDVLVAPKDESAPLEPRSRPLPTSWLVYEGSDLLVVNKPSGLLVHPGHAPGPRDRDPTLDQMVRSWLEPQLAPSLSFRPGPLHRLDRETSGLVVFSRTLDGAREFSHALANHQVTKIYLAVLRGSLESDRLVDRPLARPDGARTVVSDQGDHADTKFQPLARAQGLTLARVSLGTGRTHQIRAHAQDLGHPLAGDQKYGGGPTPKGLVVPWLLHAWRLSCSLVPAVEAPLAPQVLDWLEKTFKFSPENADALQ